MSNFKIGQTLTYKNPEDALSHITKMVKANIDFISNNELYLVDTADGTKVNSKQDILDQYKYFIDNVKDIKTITINKVDQKIGQYGPYNVYTVAVRYSQKDGDDRCLYIYNLYDFKKFDQLTADRFEIKPDFLYSTLDSALNKYINLNNISFDIDQLLALKNTFKEIQTIIDDIPSFNEETKQLEYQENSPQQAAYFDGAHKTENYAIDNDNVQYFIITAIRNDLADNYDSSKLSVRFGDSSHATLHAGPGLGNSDLILTYNNIDYEVEVKDIYTADILTGVARAAKKAHGMPYMLVYIYLTNELRLYKLIDGIELLDKIVLADKKLQNLLYNPEDLPKTYEELYTNIDEAITELKLRADADAAVNSLF